MTCTSRFTPVLVCALAFTVACGKDASSPASPSAAAATASEANADGSLLKATAPNPHSPGNGVRLNSPEVTLLTNNSRASFATVGLQYQFQVLNTGGGVVYTSGLVGEGAGTTAHRVTATLLSNTTYLWQVRPYYAGVAGPWSARASFITPETSDGFIRGNEMFDPLINGRTVGVPHGPLTFIPGRGVRLETQLSYISYELPQTLFEGEFSLFTYELRRNTEGGKTKLFAMGKGYGDIVENEYRMTVEKRGDPPGMVAWRFIARDDQIDTEGAEREIVNFSEALPLFWQATWRNNFFNVLVREGGLNGPAIYDKGKHWDGRGYEPSPHVLYVGAPVGRSGPDGASVDGVIISHVYVGPSRPAYANP